MSQVEQVHASAPWSAASQGSAVGVVSRASNLAPAISFPTRSSEIAFTYRKRILAGLLVVYLLGFNAQWRPTPDSALYLTIGRNLFEGNGFTYHGEVNRLSYRGTPFLVAATFSLFRSESLTPLLIEMFLGGVIALSLVYRLFILHDGQKMAVWMTIGVGLWRAVSSLLLRAAFRHAVFYRGDRILRGVGRRLWVAEVECDTSDATPRSLVRLGAAGYRLTDRDRDASPNGQRCSLRPWLCWALSSNVALAASRLFCSRRSSSSGAIVWTVNRRHYGRRILWPLRRCHHLEHHAQQRLVRRIAFLEYIPRLFDGVLSQTLFGCRFGIGLDALVGAAIIVAAARFLKAEPIWRLWVGLLFLTTIVAAEPIDRYFLAALPMLVYAWWKFVIWLHDRLPKAWAGYAFLLILGVGGGTNLARTLIFTTEQRRVPFLNGYMQGHFASIYAVAELVSQQVPPDGYVLGAATLAANSDLSQSA